MLFSFCFVCSVKKLPVVVPKFEWTLEWALPTPVPQHQFEQSPVVIEVTDRNPDPEKLVQNGPDAVGGYPDPLNPQASFVTVEEHTKRGYSKGFERVWLGTGDGAAKHKAHFQNSGLN